MEGSGEEEDDVVVVQAMFAQSDWTGRVSRESWYGKHSPWLRIIAFVSLSSWAWSVTAIVSVYAREFIPFADYQVSNFLPNLPDFQLPILQVTMSDEELAGIKESHKACFYSFCDDIGKKMDITCIINEDGVSARAEFGDNTPDHIDFPESCHVATEATFGYRYLEGDKSIGLSPVAFMTLQKKKLPANATTTSSSSSSSDNNKHSRKKKVKLPSLLTFLPDCTISIDTAQGMVNPEELDSIRKQLNIDDTDWDELHRQLKIDHLQDIPADISLAFNLLGLPYNSDQRLPGHREPNVLKKFLCTEEMPIELQESLLPSLATLYNFFMDHRLEVFSIGVCLFYYTTTLVLVAGVMSRLLLSALVLKRALSWPDKIRTYDIWRTLLLLCLFSNCYLNCPLFFVTMALGAWLYCQDTRASMEWLFLGVLAWGAPDVVFPLLDTLVNAVFGSGGEQGQGSADYNNFWLGIVRKIFHLLVLGEGWWKLVTVYVVYRSYQGLMLQTLSQQPASTLMQTQLDMDNLHPQPQQQQPQQQQQQQPLNQEHFKAD